MTKQRFIQVGSIYVLIDNISHVVDDGENARIHFHLRQVAGARDVISATGAEVAVFRKWLDENTVRHEKKDT